MAYEPKNGNGSGSGNSNNQNNNSDVIIPEKMAWNAIRWKKEKGGIAKLARINEDIEVRESNGKKYGNQVFYLHVEEHDDNGTYKIDIKLTPEEASLLAAKINNAIK